MKIVDYDISRITFDDSTRQRKELDLDGIVELAKSIASPIGLINPIVIDHGGRLIAGRRRLEAFKLLNRLTIPIRFKDDLTRLELATLEFDENHKRKQLTWQEEAVAIALIKGLMEEEFATRTEKVSSEEPTVHVVAEALGISEGKVYEDLMLADNLMNPRVAGRPTRSGAIQTAKRERELELVRELARRRAIDHHLEETPTSKTFAHGIIYNEDCRERLAKLADNSIDLVFMDPPWGIDVGTSSLWTKKWIHSYNDSPDETHVLLHGIIPQLYRVLKPTCHFYCFYAIQDNLWWTKEFTNAGFIVRTRPLVWFKTGQLSISDVYTSFMPSYEAVLWGWKPGENDVRRFFNTPAQEGLAFPRQQGVWHENEKPVEFIEHYIEASSSMNEVILDPFGGSGSTAVAAFGRNRYFIICEKDEVSYKKIIQRLTELETPAEEETDPK